MNTVQLVIVCVTILGALVIASQALGKRKAAVLPEDRRLLAAELGAAIARKQNDILQAQLVALDAIAEHTTPVELGPIVMETGRQCLSPPVGARVAVHKLDGQTLRGEICAQDEHEIVLEKVDLITAGDAQATGGRFHIARNRIDSIQEL